MMEDKEKFIKDYMNYNIFTLGSNMRELIRD